MCSNKEKCSSKRQLKQFDNANILKAVKTEYFKRFLQCTKISKHTSGTHQKKKKQCKVFLLAVVAKKLLTTENMILGLPDSEKFNCVIFFSLIPRKKVYH